MQNSSTNGSDSLHKLMWDMQVPERHASREIVLDDLVVVRQNLDTYEVAEMSLGRDRWVLSHTGELQSL